MASATQDLTCCRSPLLSEHLPKLLESALKELTIRPILSSLRKPEPCPIDALYVRQQFAVVLLSKRRCHVNAITGIDADQVRIERDVVQRGHADAVLNRGWPPLRIGHDMGADQQFAYR